MTPSAVSAMLNVGTGFARPVHAAQQVFRAALSAWAHPGTVRRLAPAVLQGLQPPATLHAATTACLLTLLDADTTVHLAGGLDDPGTSAYLRFHVSARPGSRSASDFVVMKGEEITFPLLDDLHVGTDQQPETGCTLVLQVQDLDEVAAPAVPHADSTVTLVELTGPGIADAGRLAIRGVPPVLWTWRDAMAPLYPCGVDLLLCSADRIVGLPRTTRTQPLSTALAENA